jgi:multicomponent K+:H+ antiporter subunit F
MMQAALTFGFAAFALALVMNLIAFVRAATVTDRILVLDTMTVNGIALIVLYGAWAGTAVYFEAAILFAMTGFVATIAFCKYLLRGDLIE